MSGKKKNNETSKKVGFYVALAVCLVAVGVAAWSTYDAVQDYDITAGTSSVSSMDPEVVSKDTPSQDNTEDGQALIDKDRDKNQLSDSSSDIDDAKETAGSVDQTPDSSAESSESSSGFIPQEQEYGVPVNAGTVYEVSEVLHFPIEDSEVIKQFSAGVPVYSDTMRDWRIHNGADFKAEAGATVKACANGVVKSTMTDLKLGNIVIVEHGEYEFWYCGVDENFIVREGDVVSTGQEIATVTAVPFEASEESHLHLEVKQDEVTINPMEILTSPTDENE